jgi:glutamate synthase (NADPH/NADH) small chain
MGKPTGFIEYQRQAVPYRDPLERAGDFLEIYTHPEEELLRTQGARCMDCGVPFCQSATGCPIDNLIPEWNDLVYHGRMREALDRLHKTNNFPEFTGRVCPAPCEGACVLGISEPPVTIKNIENEIINYGFAQQWLTAQTPAHRTGRKVAIVGSGPAGLAAADQLNKVGHQVTVYERADRIGGLLMYGIPNMKLDKRIVQRRVDLLAAEGVEFITSAHVGKREDFDRGQMTQIMIEGGCNVQFIDPGQLVDQFDAVLLATGATGPFDPTSRCPGRDLNGIHMAMEFLTRNTKDLLDKSLVTESLATEEFANGGAFTGSSMSAQGKQVIVIGGGDTGADCIGTSLRHGATSIVNFELLDQPPAQRAAGNPWPQWPRVYRVDYSHAETAAQLGTDPRQFNVLTKEYVGDNQGRLTGVKTVAVDWSTPGEKAPFTEVAGSEKIWPADLVFLATGFIGPELGISEMLGLETQNPRGNWKTFAAEHGQFTTNLKGIFAAGDCRRGQSLVVWAINEGRGAARAIDSYLMGDSSLPAPGVTQGLVAAT